MKKVLALVLAVVMVVGMASVATFAAFGDVTLEVKVDGEVQSSYNTITVESGKDFSIEVKSAADDKAEESYKVELKKLDSCAKGTVVALKSQDGKKYTFSTTSSATQKPHGTADYHVVITPISDTAKTNFGSASVTIEVLVGVDDEIVEENTIKEFKDANKDATIKAELALGKYVTISNITGTPKDLNVADIDTPSAVEEALKGKNYKFAGYKYLQPLPGVGTMEIELSADLLLANASKVYVYEVSGDKFSLVASSADDKMFEVKDGKVEFPVSRLSQYIITDKALSSTSTGSGSTSGNNPGTGANDMVGAAVVMALVAGAGIVAFKK